MPFPSLSSYNSKLSGQNLDSRNHLKLNMELKILEQHTNMYFSGEKSHKFL